MHHEMTTKRIDVLRQRLPLLWALAIVAGTLGACGGSDHAQTTSKDPVMIGSPKESTGAVFQADRTGFHRSHELGIGVDGHYIEQFRYVTRYGIVKKLARTHVKRVSE